MTDKVPAKKPAVKKAAKPATPRKRVKKDEVVEMAAPVAPAVVTTEPEVKKHVVRHTTTQNFYAVGKRKTAVAQAILSSGDGTITVNELPLASYFVPEELQSIVRSPLVSVGADKHSNIRSKIHGGGIHAQAESLRHAIARALIALDPESRRTLKKLGYLTRDPRVKERKKPGLKRARRAPQFSKR